MDTTEEPQKTRWDIHLPAHTFPCDIVIVGGTTAAIAAALAASQFNPELDVVLLEPTDWVGGQLTASAVCAIDWTNTQPASYPANTTHGIAKSPDNMTPRFSNLTKGLRNGIAWVSETTYPPNVVVNTLNRWANGYPKLRVMTETVIKSAGHSGAKITSITALKAHRRRAYEDLPSRDIPRWYDPGQTITYHFVPKPPRDLVVIDASEWGELLALAEADYAVGVEKNERKPKSSVPVGQAMVFCFAMKYEAENRTAPRPRKLPKLQNPPTVLPPPLPPLPTPQTVKDLLTATPGIAAAIDDATEKKLVGAWAQLMSDHQYYSLEDPGEFDGLSPDEKWHRIWAYRRLLGADDAIDKSPARRGEVSLQNWNPGNDYPFGYLFLDEEATHSQIGRWQGGVNYLEMAMAEIHALGWYEFFDREKPRGVHLDMFPTYPANAGDPWAGKPLLGTGHGLAKVPYMRDTRRSVGLENFTLTHDLMMPKGGGLKAAERSDAVAIGCYSFDIRYLRDLEHYRPLPQYPDYLTLVDWHKTPPGLFQIPFPALTNVKRSNLLVAGKTMAQSALANAATRLHPIEWATGTAAGVAAAMMATTGVTSTTDFSKKHLPELQKNLQPDYTPIRWTL